MKSLVFLFIVFQASQVSSQELIDYVLPQIKVSENLINSVSYTSSVFKGEIVTQRPFKVQFYGQSIIAGIDKSRIKRQLLKLYPGLDFEIINNAIGGYQAPQLIKTAEYDLYPEYADLIVFHVYGGLKNGELEKLFSNIRTRLSSDVIILDHHISFSDTQIGQQRLDKLQDSDSKAIEQLAHECGFGFLGVRALWKDFLNLNPSIKVKDLLRDGVHPNDLGKLLLEWIVINNLKKAIDANPGIPSASKQHVIKEDKDTVEFEFTGNRIDLQPSKQSIGAQFDLFIDGIPASQDNGLYSVSRPSSFPRQWWPAMNRIILNKNVNQIEEEWTITFIKLDIEEESFEFQLIGDISGEQGIGYSGKNFISKNKAIEINAGDIAIFPLDKSLKNQDLRNFVVTFSVYPLFNSPVIISNPQAIVLAKLLEDKTHTVVLKIIKGNLKNSSFKFYEPNK
jgi:hypothetical protein